MKKHHHSEYKKAHQGHHKMHHEGERAPHAGKIHHERKHAEHHGHGSMHTGNPGSHETKLCSGQMSHGKKFPHDKKAI